MCAACDAGTFSATGADTSCTPWRMCAPGTAVIKQPSAAADRMCAPCVAGRTFAGSANADVCVAVVTCPPGEYVSFKATASSNRVCEQCEGSFEHSLVENAESCTPHTKCGAGTYESTPPSATADRTCAALSDCEAGTFVIVSASTTWDRTCQGVTVGLTYTDVKNLEQPLYASNCTPGTFVSTVPTAVADRRCSPCPPQTFSVDENAAGCVPAAVCNATLLCTSPSTTTTTATPGTTGPLPEPGMKCDVSEFIAAELTPSSNRICQQHSQCRWNEGVYLGATATADRQCGCPPPLYGQRCDLGDPTPNPCRPNPCPAGGCRRIKECGFDGINASWGSMYVCGDPDLPCLDEVTAKERGFVTGRQSGSDGGSPNVAVPLSLAATIILVLGLGVLYARRRKRRSGAQIERTSAFENPVYSGTADPATRPTATSEALYGEVPRHGPARLVLNAVYDAPTDYRGEVWTEERDITTVDADRPSALDVAIARAIPEGVDSNSDDEAGGYFDSGDSGRSLSGDGEYMDVNPDLEDFE